MYGLALEGGGAKGAYHIGAYKALTELGYEISGVAGTSIGAINGALLAQGDFELVEKFWEEIEPAEILTLSAEELSALYKFDFNRDNLGQLFNKIKSLIDNRGIEVDSIRDYLDKYVDEEKVRSSDIDFGMVTYSLTDFEPLEIFIEDIPEGKLIDYLIASSYLPAFKREKIDGKTFIDGGFYDNLPINLLSRRGYTDIIAIRTYSSGRIRTVEAEVDVEQIGPTEDLGRLLEFVPDRIDRNIKLGYLDTKKHFLNLAGRKYYLQAPENDAFYFQLWQLIDDDSIREAASLLGYKPCPPLRLLFEKIMPRLHTLLDLEEGVGYQELMIASLEVLALKIQIEPYQIYNFATFLRKITSTYQKDLAKDIRKLPSFLKQNELLSRAVRDDLVLEVITTLFSGFCQQEEPHKFCENIMHREDKNDNKIHQKT